MPQRNLYGPNRLNAASCNQLDPDLPKSPRAGNFAQDPSQVWKAHPSYEVVHDLRMIDHEWHRRIGLDQDF